MTNDAQSPRPNCRGGAIEPTAPAPARVAAPGRRHWRTGEMVCTAADVPAAPANGAAIAAEVVKSKK